MEAIKVDLSFIWIDFKLEKMSGMVIALRGDAPKMDGWDNIGDNVIDCFGLAKVHRGQ